MKRRLTIEFEVGDAADHECGECPFRALDWDFGVPGGRYFCSCPAWELAEVTAGRHRACIEAGEDHEGTSRLSQAILKEALDGNEEDVTADALRLWAQAECAREACGELFLPTAARFAEALGVSRTRAEAMMIAALLRGGGRVKKEGGG